jgi:hypothetical protein
MFRLKYPKSGVASWSVVHMPKSWQDKAKTPNAVPRLLSFINERLGVVMRVAAVAL